MPIPQKQNQETRLSAKAYVYKTLREWIIDGTLKPGEKIYDQEIAQYFSVSRTPVREAMQLLSDQKLIDITPGKESKVSELDKESTKQSYILLADLHTRALRFAWDNLITSDVELMKSKNEALKKYAALGELKKAHEMDKAFHDVIVINSKNDYIKNFTDILLSHVQRVEYQYFTSKNDYENSGDSHEQIIKAIEENNLEAACEALRQNWLRTMDTVDKLEDL